MPTSSDLSRLAQQQQAQAEAARRDAQRQLDESERAALARRRQSEREAKAQADAARKAAQKQQADAETAAKASEREAKTQADAARKAELSRLELEYRSQGMIPVTTADGNLHPDPLFGQKQAAKAAKEQAAADKAAADLRNKQARADLTRKGIRHSINPVDGSPITHETEADVAARIAESEQQKRRQILDDQIRKLDSEHEWQLADAAQQGFKILSRNQNGERLLETKALPKLKQDALFALQAKLQQQAKAVSGGADWIPFNEAATPEAAAAQERLARLSQPGADLTEEDLAELEADDATKPTVAKIRQIQDQLAKDDELSKAADAHKARIASLKLKRDNPQAWLESERQRRMRLSPEDLQADLEATSADLDARRTAIEEQATALNSQVETWNLQLETLNSEAAQRRQQGLTAGDIVTYQLEDGTTEVWPRDLAAKREQIAARLQDTQAMQQDDWTRLKLEEQDLIAEAGLVNEAAQHLNQITADRQVQQSASVSSRLRFTPGMEQAATEIEALEADAATRKAVLDDMYPDGIPPEALDALNADIQSRAEQAIQTGEARLNSAISAYGDIQSQLAANPDLNATAGDLYIAARQQLAQAAGISEDEARRLIDDAALLDWDQVTADEMNKGLVPDSWKSGWKFKPGSWLPEGGNATQADDARTTRTLSNGALIVHPRLSAENDYLAAVEAADATPEAKADAIARYPQIRKAQARQTLETIQEIQATLGSSALSDWENYSDWAKKRPADVDEAEWALRWTEHNKAQNTGPLGTLLSKTKQFLGGLAAGGNDLRQQASGLLAGITGSETLMQDAQWAGRKAEAQTARLELGGHTSGNFLTKGIFDQLPRLGVSILPAGGGAKAAQTGLRLFAGTKLGGRLLPSVAAALQKAATPAQAAKAVTALTRAGLGGAAAAGGAQTYGAQLTDIYSTLRRENPELSHTEALRQAQMPAIVSGLGTALITTAFGSTGVSRLLTRPAEAKALATKVFTSQMQRLGFASDAFLAGGIMETIEETLDEGLSTVAAAVGKGQDVQQALGDFFRTLPEMAVATTLMGGAGQGIAAYQESGTRRSNLPETVAPAWTAIENHRALDAAGNEDPVLTEQQQRRAALALSLVQGGELFDVEAADLAAAGWTRDGDKFKPLKDYTGPQVLDIDSNGLPVIKDSYIAALRQTGLAPVADAIGMTETETRNFYAQRNDPNAKNTPAGSQQPQQSGNASAPAGPRSNANPSPVQAPAGTGNEPPRSGSTPPPPGDALDPAVNPVNPVNEVPTTPADFLTNHFTDRGLPRDQAAAAAADIAARPEFKGMSYEEIITSNLPFATALEDLGITGSLNSRDVATNPLKIQPGGRLEKIKALREKQAEEAKAAASANTVPPVNPVNKVPTPDFTALRAKLAAKEISDQDAAREVAQRTGSTTKDEFIAAIVKHLGWKEARAEISANLHFGTKDESPIPLASGKRDAANRVPVSKSPSAPVSPAGTRQGPDVSLAADPSPIRRNRAYAADKLRVLAGIKDPSKKAWARQFFTALEQSLQRHHTLYDAYAVGGPARKHLDGQMTAVLEVEGKITRLIDLDAMVAQFDYLQSPQDALRATSIEEDIHAAVLQLARENPDQYGYTALRQKWQQLPTELKRTVWQAYRAANQNTASADEAVMPDLTEVQEWHMMNEFLRMLVQDSAFAGAITESVDTATGLIGWVQNLLRDLSKLLKDLMKKVQPDLRANLEGMVAQISERLRQIEQASAAQSERLATLPSLRDPAAYADTVLQQVGAQDNAGILSPDALARVFDQLDPALQSRAFQQFTSSGRRADKAVLMRGLLSQFLGSRRDSLRLSAALAGMQSPPKTTTLLTKLMDRLLDRVQAPEILDLLAAQSPQARRNLKNLHIATLRAIGGIRSASFVHDLGSKPGLVTALEADPTKNEEPETKNQAKRKSDFLAAMAAREQDHEDARADANQAKLRDRLRQEEAENPALEVIDEEAARIERRLADFLAALDDRDRQIELDHRDAASPGAGPALRRKLRQEELAAAHQIAYMRGEALAEIQQHLDNKRLPEPQRRLLFDILQVAAGRFSPDNRRAPAGNILSYRAAGFSLEQTLKNLGLRITERGTLVTLDPVNTAAYVERGHVILRQDTLDTLADFYPAVAAYIHLRLGSEYDQRQKAGLPTFAKPEPQTTDEAPTPTDLPVSPSQSLPVSEEPTFTPTTPPLQDSPSPRLPVSPSPSLSFPIPLSKRGQVRRAQFPDADSLAAFQFKLDADTVASARSTPAEVKKAEQRGLALLARLMEETGRSRSDLEKQLLEYHTTLVQQAEAASAFGTFTPPSFASVTNQEQGTKNEALPAPVGGDILSGMNDQGIRRLGPPDASDGWAWYRSLQADATLSKLKNAEAQRLAKKGDLTDAKAKLAWIDSNIVSQTGGRPIDEAAAELGESDDQRFPVTTGDELGRAILDAIDARIAAKQTDSVQDVEARQAAEATAAAQDFATYAAGTTGQPFTTEQLAQELEPEDEIQIGAEWFTVQDTDPLTLDSARFGSVTPLPGQTLNLTAGPNHLRIRKPSLSDSPATRSNVAERSAQRSPGLAAARAELIAAVAADTSLFAANRLSTEEKQRIIASIYAHNESEDSGTRISTDYQGGEAWFTPDNRYFHNQQHWFMLPDDTDYTQAMQAGFVRLSFERGTDKTLWAEFYPPLSTKKIERLRTQALMKGAELQLDPDRTQTLAAANRLTPAQVRAAVLDHLDTPLTRDFKGEKAWLMPDGQFAPVDDHYEILPYHPNGDPFEGWMLQEAGIVRIEVDRDDGYLYADHTRSLTHAQRQAIRDTALERGIKYQFLNTARFIPQGESLAAANRFEGNASDMADRIRTGTRQRWKDEYGDEPASAAMAWWIDRSGNALPVIMGHEEIGVDIPEAQFPLETAFQMGFIRASTDGRLGGEDKDVFYQTGQNQRPTQYQLRTLRQLAEDKGGQLIGENDPRNLFLAAANRTRLAAASYVEKAVKDHNFRTLADLLRFAATDLPADTFAKLRTPHLYNAWNTVQVENNRPEATRPEEAAALRALEPRVERRFGEMPPDIAAKQQSVTPESIGIPTLKLAKQAEPVTPTDLLGNPITEHTEEDDDDADPEDKVKNRGSSKLQRLQAIDELYGPLAPGVEVMATQNQDDDTVPHIMRGRGVMLAIDGQPHVAIRSVALPSIGTGYAPGVRFLPLAGDKSNWTGHINKAIQIADPQLDEHTDVYIEPYGGGLVYLQNLEPLLKTSKPVLIASSQEFEPDRNLIYTTLKRGDAAALADIQAILGDINHKPQTDAGSALVRVFYSKSKKRIVRKLSPDAAAQLPNLVALLQRPNVKILPWNDVQTFENTTAIARNGKRVTLLEDSNYADLYAEGTQDQYKGIDTHPDMFNAGKITNFIGKDPKKLLAQKLPVYRAVLDAGGTVIATNNMNPDLINGLLAEFGDAGHWFGYAHRTRPVPDGFMRHPDGKGVLWSTERPEYLAILRKGVVNPPAGAPKYGTDTSAGLDYRTGPRRLLEGLDRGAQPHRAPSPHTGGSLEAAQSIGGPADTGGRSSSAGPVPSRDSQKTPTLDANGNVKWVSIQEAMEAPEPQTDFTAVAKINAELDGARDAANERDRQMMAEAGIDDSEEAMTLDELEAAETERLRQFYRELAEDSDPSETSDPSDEALPASPRLPVSPSQSLVHPATGQPLPAARRTPAGPTYPGLKKPTLPAPQQRLELFDEWVADLSSDNLVGFRGEITPGRTNGFGNTEGNGIYLMRDRQEAAVFGTVQRVSFPVPQRPFLVTNDDLYLLQESDELDEPINPAKDTPWLQASKYAAQHAHNLGKGKWNAQLAGDILTKLLMESGYDSVYVKGMPDDWVVLLRETRPGQKPLAALPASQRLPQINQQNAWALMLAPSAKAGIATDYIDGLKVSLANANTLANDRAVSPAVRQNARRDAEQLRTLIPQEEAAWQRIRQQYTPQQLKQLHDDATAYSVPVAELQADLDNLLSDFPDAATRPSWASAQIESLQSEISQSPSLPLSASPRQVLQVEPGFYSALAEAIRTKMPARGTPAQILGILKNAGLKAEEMKWTGIAPWLQTQAQDGPITQQQVLDHLATEGSVKFTLTRLQNPGVEQESEKERLNQRNRELTDQIADLRRRTEEGIISDAQAHKELRTISVERADIEQRLQDLRVPPQRNTQWTLPGGTNPKEVVVTWNQPTIGDRALSMSRQELINWYRSYIFDDVAADAPESVISTNRLRELFATNATQDHRTNPFHASPNDPSDTTHYGDLDALAWYRTTDRTNTAGPGLLVEEFQSKWHQRGRDEGYQNDALMSRALQDEFDAVSAIDRRERTPAQEQRYQELNAQWNNYRANGGRGVPDAPYRASWPLMLFKRALLDAVQAGKSWIGWTTGDTQADRYDLRNHITEVRYKSYADGTYKVGIVPKGQPPVGLTDSARAEDLPDLVGKDLAQRILNGEGDPSGPDGTARRFSGLDLRVGGKGMRKFYDEMLVKEFGKYAKQLGGGTVESSEVNTSTILAAPDFKPITASDWETFAGAEAFANGDRPLFAETTINVDGVPESVLVIIDANGLQMISAEGDTNWMAPNDVFPGQTSSGWWRSAASAQSAVEIAWKVKLSKFWRELQPIVGEGTATPREGTTPIHLIRITPPMRDSVSAGQALFASGRTPILTASRDVTALRSAKDAWTAAGFPRDMADDIVDRFYKPAAFADIPSNAVLLPMPSTSGRNILPDVLAQRIAKQQGATVQTGRVASATARTEAKKKTSFWAKMDDPVGYIPGPAFDAMRRATGPIYLVEDVHNTGESWMAMRRLLEDNGIPVAGVATLTATELRVTSPRDIERLSEKIATLTDTPLDETTELVYGLFHDSYKQWFNKAERIATGDARQAIRLLDAARAHARERATQPNNEAANEGRVQGQGNQDALAPSYEQLSLFASSRLKESAIQGYFDLPNVAVPAAKQPTAKRAIRAAGNASTERYAPQLPATAGKLRQLRERLEQRRADALRSWRGLTTGDRDAITTAFEKNNGRISSLLHEFIQQGIPGFDIRGAILENPQDFAAFNLAVRTPYFESVKIAVLGDGRQVIHSQIVHVGSLNESIFSPVLIAGIIDAARLANPKLRIEGFLIAHNHPSGDTDPSDADKRSTNRLRDIADTLGVPFLDHVITNGSSYYSFRENRLLDTTATLAEGSRPRKPKLPVLPTPEQMPARYPYERESGILADWEVVPSGDTDVRPRIDQPWQMRSLLEQIGTADPLHHHLLYFDTRNKLRAVERIPAATQNIAALAITGAAREGASGIAIGFAPRATSTETAFMTDQERRIHFRLREALQRTGINYLDAGGFNTSSQQAWSAAEMGLMEDPTALFAAPRRARQSMTFDPPFQAPFGDILRYEWTSKPVGGMDSQRISDWDNSVTNGQTGRAIVHLFKVRKPDGIHTVSLETAMGLLSDTQRRSLNALIRSHHQRQQEERTGQMALFAAHRQFAPAIRFEGRVTAAPGGMHYDALVEQVRRTKLPSWQREQDDSRRLAIRWIRENPNAIEKDYTEGFMTPEGFKDRSEALTLARALGYQGGNDAYGLTSADIQPPAYQGEMGLLASSARISDPPFSTPEAKALEETRIHAIDAYLHGKRRPIANTPAADQARNSRAQLQALTTQLSRGQRPSGPPAADEKARIAEARRSDKALLIEWARNAGVLLTETPDRFQLNSPEDKGGGEHHVFHDQNINRWVKITKGDGTSFGYQPLNEGKGDEWMISKDPADLRSYLEKLALHNQVFHDDIVLHGVIADPLGKVSLIISQPDYQGTFAGVYTSIKPAMAAAGFVRVEPPSARREEPSAYYRPADNVAVIDLHSENAILQDNGTFLRVFDNIILQPTGALRATFERLAAQRTALPAADRTYSAAIEATGLQPAIQVKGRTYTGHRGMWHPEIIGHYVWKNVFTAQQRRDDPAPHFKASKFALEEWMDAPGSGFDDFGFIDLPTGDFVDREEAYRRLVARGIPIPPDSWTATNQSLDSSDVLKIAAALPASPRLPVSPSPSLATQVAQAAAQTDTNPTGPQKDAENYKTGKVDVHGLRLSIENPAGSVRRGTDANGKPWSVTMPHHYGRILGTTGRDKDHLDFFLGPNPDSQLVLIVNQRKPGNGHFDEHKLMLGFNTPAEAARGYLASYTKGWKGLGSAVPTTIPVLKHWITTHDTTQPVTKEQIEKLAKTLPLPTSPHDKPAVTKVNPVNPVPLAASQRQPDAGITNPADAAFVRARVAEWQDAVTKADASALEAIDLRKKREVADEAFRKASPEEKDARRTEALQLFDAEWEAKKKADSAPRAIQGLYIRFGIPPASGRSQNFITSTPDRPRYEKGISTFPITWENGRWNIVTGYGSEPSLDFLIGDANRHIYLMTGTVVDEGEDNEPVLGQDSRILKELSPQEILPPSMDEETWAEESANWTPLYASNRLGHTTSASFPIKPDMDQYQTWKGTKEERDAEWERWHRDIASWEQAAAEFAAKQGNLGLFVSGIKTGHSKRPYRQARAVTRIPGKGDQWRVTLFSQQITTPEYTPQGDWANDAWVPISHDEFPTKQEAYREALREIDKQHAFTTQPLFAGLRIPIGTAITRTASAVATGTERTLQVANTLTTALGIQQPLATFGTNKLDKRLAAQLDKLAGSKVRSAKTAVETWLDKPEGLAPTIKGLVDQVLPTALLPREWLALHHEMQRKTAYGQETANDLIRALSGNPRLSDLAYPKEFAENPAARAQLFDAMEGRIPMATLPPEMQRLGQRLRDLLRQTGSELVRQGLMNPDTFEELQSNGWMPRYTEDEANESAGSFLAAFKLGVRDLLQQRSTAYHIVDTTRKDKTGQYVTVSRDEGGKRNRWRFRDAASRDAFYHDFVRQQTLAMLQDRSDRTVADMLAPLSRGDKMAMRDQIKSLTVDQIANTAKLSPMLAGIVKQAKKHQYDRFLPKDPFEPAKLVKDPVYAVARYTLGQTHNASTMELLRKTAANPEWVSDIAITGYTAIPDASRFGPLAGKHVRKDIAAQILDLVDVPNAALKFYDGILRKWKAGKLVWNPGSHVRDAVGNTMFAYLAGSSIWNPGNWPHYQQAIAALRTGGQDFAELIEQQVIGGDAYSGLVKERLKGLLPDPKTVEGYDPGLVQRMMFGFGATLHGSHEFLAALRRLPDDLFKAAAYFKAKAEFEKQPQTTANNGQPPQTPAQQAAQHVRKWFPYYDRLGQSGTTRAVGRFVNPFVSFFRESTRILGTAVVERPLALTSSLAFPAIITALSAMMLGLDDDDMDEIQKDMAGKGKLFATGTPLFSMLLPFRSAQGAVQQFDISAVMPFADLLGTRVVVTDADEDPWNRFWRGIVSGGPVLSLIDAWRHNEDAFTRRPIAEFGMTPLEKITAYGKHAAGVALPPLAPGGTAFGTLLRAGDRSTNKTLERYDPAQAVVRSVVGLNIKNATPDLYRLADDWRKAHGYEVTEGMDYGSTTPASRARKALFAKLAQDEPNLEAISNILKRLNELGHPVRTEQDINKLLFYRDPLKLIGGNKAKGITPQDAQAQFRASLQGEARQALERALQEYQRIKAKAPLIVRQAAAL